MALTGLKLSDLPLKDFSESIRTVPMKDFYTSTMPTFPVDEKWRFEEAPGEAGDRIRSIWESKYTHVEPSADVWASGGVLDSETLRKAMDKVYAVPDKLISTSSISATEVAAGAVTSSRGLHSELGSQVYVEDRFVGWLVGHDPKDKRGVMIRKASALPAGPDDMVPFEGPEYIRLTTKKRSVSFNRYLIATKSAMEMRLQLEKMHVPPDAEQTRHADVDELRYVWWVFQIDLDTYEHVFDLDEFVPV